MVKISFAPAPERAATEWFTKSETGTPLLINDLMNNIRIREGLGGKLDHGANGYFRNSSSRQNLW
jgi:hypothetical protein